jgi:protein arginine kinase
MTDGVQKTDVWLSRKGPEEHVVISSRARYARNLPKLPFPLRASSDELQNIASRVREAVQATDTFSEGLTFDLANVPAIERNYLKESHLISTEMEKGATSRLIYLDQGVTLAVMVNEEDHLRMYAIETGFQLASVLQRLVVLEDNLAAKIHFAFSHQYGYLTACPTNTGTGLRASVMLHLPALVISKQITEMLKGLATPGLTVRGFYGENSEFIGDFFQISNEITLGLSEEEIMLRLTTKVEQFIEREEQARRALFEKNAVTIDDDIWRAWGTLKNARMIESQEAVRHLSRLRLGIDRNYFGALTHAELSKLVVEVQPGHLQVVHGESSSERRDVLRAELLRARLHKFQP